MPLVARLTPATVKAKGRLMVTAASSRKVVATADMPVAVPRQLVEAKRVTLTLVGRGGALGGGGLEGGALGGGGLEGGGLGLAGGGGLGLEGGGGSEVGGDGDGAGPLPPVTKSPAQAK